MRITRRAATTGMVSMAISAQAIAEILGQARVAQSSSSRLSVYGAKMAVELGPLHLAVRRLYGPDATVNHGGVVNLVDEGRLADVASNGETQTLRASVKGPDMRILMTVAEGHYPVIARRSAGISSLADLKGKRVLSYRHTTAGYFLHKMLKTVGLTLDDVTIVQTPLGEVGTVVSNREVDAIAIWEPDSEQALRALRGIGEDVIIFSGQGVYHERYNLCTTADALADPAKRREIVTFTRTVMDVVADINRNPEVAAEAQAAVAKSGGLYTVEEVALGWPNVRFVASFDETLLDVLAEEDVWLAAEEKRQPRSREQLARLIDRSVYDEAKALPART
ncbi:MAG TPA: ABC transporter substrate-binding protein [Steroidobacteraceae bacterium]